MSGLWVNENLAMIALRRAATDRRSSLIVAVTSTLLLASRNVWNSVSSVCCSNLD
jgi:hypothetical protein